MRTSLLLAVWAFGLASCVPSSLDSFCRAHSAVDLTPTREAYGLMGVAERRASQARLDEAARRCGWEP